MRRAEPTTPGSNPRESLVLARDALAIVLAGVALGLAYNYLGLVRRPPRGLPWIAAERRLDRLERAASALPAAPTTSHPPRPGPRQPAAVEPAARSNSPGAALEASALPVRPPEAGATNPPATGADPPPGLPVIPVADRPLKVELATVARYVEAGAALVVDAREPVEFAQGHIPGAVNIPYDQAVRHPDRLESLDPREAPIIVYCSGGTCEASRMLAEMLVRDFKRPRVLVYEAGFPEWVAAGMPVARGEP